jgi:hypothetical protein
VKIPKDISDAVASVQLARRELKQNTVHLVAAMREAGRSDDYASGYIAGVTQGLIPEAADAAQELFAKEWERTSQGQP